MTYERRRRTRTVRREKHFKENGMISGGQCFREIKENEVQERAIGTGIYEDDSGHTNQF